MQSPVEETAADRCATGVVDVKDDAVKADETPRIDVAATNVSFIVNICI